MILGMAKELFFFQKTALSCQVQGACVAALLLPGQAAEGCGCQVVGSYQMGNTELSPD